MLKLSSINLSGTWFHTHLDRIEGLQYDHVSVHNDDIILGRLCCHVPAQHSNRLIDATAQQDSISFDATILKELLKEIAGIFNQYHATLSRSAWLSTVMARAYPLSRTCYIACTLQVIGL